MQGQALAITTATGHSHSKIILFPFIQFQQKLPEDVPFCCFAKRNIHTLKTEHFPFFFADVSHFVLYLGGTRKTRFLHNPPRLNSAMLHLFFENMLA